uniref:RNase H type-1 domain-containing protein n=1 Tax=Davidia involucrata TaxID=16924 RepID=A0A5B7BJR2_DAVIN
MASFFSREAGIHEVIVEGDCSSIVTTISAQDDDFSALGHILDGINASMAGFRSCSCSHIRRTANRVAHEIASFAQSAFGDHFWMEKLPACFDLFLARDASHL